MGKPINEITQQATVQLRPVPETSRPVPETSYFTMNFGGSIRVNKIGVVILGVVIVLALMMYRSNSNSIAEENDDNLVSLKRLLAAAIDAAERGGKIVYDIREEANLNEESKGKTKEGANDPVTDGDLQSHLTMFHSIQHSFPSVQIISEEHDNSKFDSSKIAPASTVNSEVEMNINGDTVVEAGDIRIWIDPLDATQEYTENLREYVTTMVCVAVGGVPTIGVIHKPFEKLTAWGWLGKGVSPTLKVSEEQAGPKDAISHIIVSRSHAGDVEEVAKTAFGDDTVVIPAGGAGFKTLSVIQGNADAYVHTTLIKKWDLCAGNAILNALSGKMTNLDGQTIDYSSKEAYKNEGGVLATLYKHDFYLEKLKVLKKS